MNDALAMARKVELQIDDVLGTTRLVHDNRHLLDELFDTLVDLLVEHILLELAVGVSSGMITHETYEHEFAEFARQCRAAGLLTHD